VSLEFCDTGPGEKRGGTITGGTVVTIKPGDFLVVPAGQPHLTMINPGSIFRAIVFKAGRKGRGTPLV